MAEKAQGLRGGGSHSRLSPNNQSRSLSDSLTPDHYTASTSLLRAPPITVTARLPPPRLDFGQAARPESSGPVLGGGDRLRPLTPIHTKTNSGGNVHSYAAAAATIRTTKSTNSLNNNSNSRGRQPPTPTAPRGSGGRHPSRPRGSPAPPRKSSSNPGTPHPHGKPSVKHLTCFWWKEKGDCRFKEEDCLYAHRDTGIYADPPRQVIPGEPAMAGRSLDRALKKLHSEHNKSSTSLKSMGCEILADSASRPETPVTEPPVSPAVISQSQSENILLRNIVEQNMKEKEVLITMIENLQEENKTLKTENVALKAENDGLKNDRHYFRTTLSEIQISQRQAPTSNPYGPVGSNPGLAAFRRAPVSQQFDANSGVVEHAIVPSPTESDNQTAQVDSMLRHLGRSF